MTVNAWGPGSFALACQAAGSRFVHFSTDHVFGLDASRRTPLAETDLPGPVSVYGLSKLAGEYFVQVHCPNSLIVRTCGLYGLSGSGGKGGNFVETMLRLAREGKPIRVVSDQYCTPSSAADVATAVNQLLEKGATGLVHVTNSDSCTWYEFAAEIFRQAGLKPSLNAIRSSEYGAAARRPSYSVLSCEKLAGFGVSLPSWQDALAAYLRERERLPK
jgi:dTDP-4-dehydrorhamnose reductase